MQMGLIRPHMSAAGGITYVPIRPHIIRKSDGTGGFPLKNLNNVLALNNRYYLLNGMGIQFYLAGTTPDYIDDDGLYAQFVTQTDESKIAARDVTNAMNQYYVQKFSNGIGGYAYFPGNSIQTTRSFILVGPPETDEDLGNRLIPHELGHNFNLLHTFERAYGTERVTRGAGANCTTTGDLVCDTPADPYGLFAGASYDCISGCPPTYTCNFTDVNGDKYAPSPTNIMSYYFPCTHDFSPGQYDRMQNALALRLSHSAYTLNFPPTAAAAPTNLAGTVNSKGSAVTLTWTDNANNEMGYFVERSTLPNSGFLGIGGVGPNETTFVDTKLRANTTYYYRVRPSNTTTGSISSVTSATVGSCRPTMTLGCVNLIGLSGLTVKGTTLSQNSGCGADYYTSFTGSSATVTAGQSTTFTATFLNGSNPQGVTIWADLNRDGAYDNAEIVYTKLFSSPFSINQTDNLTIPAGTAAGSLPVRVIITYSSTPNEPCGTYTYGETEDYLFTVAPSCSPVTASISGSLTICQGQSTTLTASGGTSYVWSTGATSATITASASGPYSVTATVSGGCSGTATVSVTVNPLPQITVQPPTSLTICPASPLSVTLTATGPSLTYQWYRNSLASPISGQTSPVLSLTGLTSAQSGAYFCVVTSSCGSLTSASTNLTVTATNDYVSVKTGNWNDATLWTCGKVPTLADTVILRHTVALPASYTGSAKALSVETGGLLQTNTGATLNLSQ